MVARTDGDSSRQPPPAFHLSAVPATDITTQTDCRNTMGNVSNARIPAV